MDIYIWISVYRYPQRYPCALFRYLYVDILFKLWISNYGYLGSIWDIYMPTIIPQPIATDPLHGRTKIAAIRVKVFTIA